MAISELHQGSLIIPKTTISWHGAGATGLSLFIEENFGKTEIIASPGVNPLSFDIEFGRANEMMYHSARYGGSFGLVPNAEVDGYFFKFPKDGVALLAINADEAIVERGDAVAFRGPFLRQLKYKDNFQESQISFSASHCIERLSILLDRPVTKPLIFTPKVSVISNSLSKFAALAHFLCESEFGDLLSELPLRAVRLSALAVDIALSTWPHTYSEDLQRRPPSIAPRHVKAAIEYIRDHPFDLTSPEHLAHISGVSVRALQYSFKNVTGQTISEYQKELRLIGARKEIIDTSQSIKDIAHKWGFFSSGRFSAYFREAYGVYPNELRRGESIQKEL